MRTTLDIDDDVLFAAKEIASREKKTAGKILSEVFRRGLHAAPSDASKGSKQKNKPVVKNGIPLFPSRGEIITTEKVQRLMDEEGI
jgi:hypothetical protein